MAAQQLIGRLESSDLFSKDPGIYRRRHVLDHRERVYYLYSTSGDEGYWKNDPYGNARFVYTYTPGRWYDNDYLNGRNPITLAGYSDAFIGDGARHRIGDWWDFRYVSNTSYWTLLGFANQPDTANTKSDRFSYNYLTGQWYQKVGQPKYPQDPLLDPRMNPDNEIWKVVGDTGRSSAFIGDGAYHTLYADGAKYRYGTSGQYNDWGFWYSTGIEGQSDFAFHYVNGDWIRSSDNTVGYGNITYLGSGKYMFEKWMYYASDGWLKYTPGDYLGRGTDIHCYLWNANTKSNIGDWYIFTPGSDMSWSGGALDVVVMNSNSNSLWMKAWEQYTKEDVITIEYNLEGGASLATVLQGLGYITSFYGKTIDDLAVHCHGNYTGFYFGNWIYTSNYTSFATQWTQLNNLMTDGGQLQLYHCETGSAASILSDIASRMNARVFANVNDQWNSFWYLNSKYSAGNANVWNYNYRDPFFGRSARQSGEDITIPKQNFIDEDFEYQSDGSGKRAYKMLFTPYNIGYSQEDMVYWWNDGNGRP